MDIIITTTIDLSVYLSVCANSALLPLLATRMKRGLSVYSSLCVLFWSNSLSSAAH